MKIVVDMMGSDLGSKATVPAVKNFINKHKDCQVVAVGKKEELTELEGLCEIVDARDVVPMDAGAMEVLRMKESSMVKALDTLLASKGDAIISAGGTGAFLTSSTIKLKKIEGIMRPALVSPFPTKIKGKFVTILDVGASNENTPEELLQFGLMGKIYASKVMGIDKPNVYLLSNGTEEEKGSPTVKAAHELFKKTNFEGFKGNVEAREALNGEADVIVMDGFTGNVFLKSTEGVAKMMSGLMKKGFKKNLLTKIGYLFAKKGMDEMKETMDYKKVGGAMLLGVNGVVVKAHGSADAFTFGSALEITYKMAKSNVVSLIKEGLVNEGH